MLGFDTVYLHAKCDNSSFSRSKNISGASKFKVYHVYCFFVLTLYYIFTGSTVQFNLIAM